MRKNLILIGNKPPMRDSLANGIDSFDYVIRINKMNYLGHTGNRIDGLYLEANNNSSLKMMGVKTKSRLNLRNKF